MTVQVFRPTYLIEELGELGRLPDGAIVNIGGTTGPTFTVGGRPLMFADGSSTGPGGGGITLQNAYDNGVTPQINLSAGRNFIINALNGKKFVIDAATGLVTIEGDLTVLGESTVINGTISNLDQVNIGMPNSTTTGLTLQPNSGVTPTVDLIQISNVFGGPPVFRVDALGTTVVSNLVVSSGLVNGVDLATLNTLVNTHLNNADIPAKHAASQISVAGPLSNLPGDNVQEVLESINAVVLNSGTGTVTSVDVTSADLTVGGAPITTAGTITLSLNTVPISKGGTGETTAAAAINALVPPQAGNTGKVLGTDGNTVAWVVGGVSSTGAGLFFINAAPTSTGIVGDKQFVPGTTPANRVVYEATTDTNNVTVTLFAEGDSAFYSPTVTITTMPPQLGGPVVATLTEDAADRRAFNAVAALTNLTVDTVVNAVSSTGATATMTLLRAALGPAFTALTIGLPPGGQTEVKAGDIVTVTGVVQNSATYAELLAGGANSALATLTLGPLNSAGAGFRTVGGSFTVAGGTGALTVSARASNSLGTFGATFTSTNTITLNQTFPVIGPRTITYPVGQQALKGSESATVAATVTNFDTILYSGVNLSIAFPTTYAASKTATRTGGTYSVGVNNYTITATKASNGAVATASSAVSIADAAPTAAITIVGSPTRLFSSPTGVNYTVTITANQQLLNAPSLAASSGTWQGSWTGSGTTWTRVLRIVDTDPKGAQLFSALSLTGLAGVPGSTITSGASYIVGGFAARTITFPAFARWEAIGTTVVDFSKVTASYTGSSVLTRRSDTNDVFQSFTIVDAAGNFDPNGGYLFISDAAFAGANTSGTLQLTVAEAA